MNQGLPREVIGPDGGLRLQCCSDCGAWAYPPRAVCGQCLSDRLVWCDHPGIGVVIAAVSVAISLEPDLPPDWPLVSVRLATGQTVLAKGPGLLTAGQAVRVTPAEDTCGRIMLTAAATNAESAE